MDKVIETLCNLISREEKLFSYKFVSFEETKIPDNVQLGLIFLYCEYIEMNKILDQLCIDNRLSDQEKIISHDFYQIITARIIELTVTVHQIREPLWMTMLTKKKWTEVN